MNIGIVGLGLIGGSLLKAIKRFTDHYCYGDDKSNKVFQRAKPFLHGRLHEDNIKDMQILFVCLPPTDIVDYIKKNINKFKSNSLVVDVGGIKEFIVDEVEPLLCAKQINFIGGHPMAGKEVGGFENSSENFFVDASFIITPIRYNKTYLDILKELLYSIGFSNITETSPEQHDKIIAFTSQLAHIISSSYIKSPTLKHYHGFTGGSFEDLTRVAILDSAMWTDLLMLNKKNILHEIDILLQNVNEYKKTLEQDNKEQLKRLLERGNQLKTICKRGKGHL